MLTELLFEQMHFFTVFEVFFGVRDATDQETHMVRYLVTTTIESEFVQTRKATDERPGGNIVSVSIERFRSSFAPLVKQPATSMVL